MKKSLVILSLAGAFIFAACETKTETAPVEVENTNPMVGGAAMFDTLDIIDNAVNSADHTTLVAAVQAAGLVETLKTDGPFTVFAPTNDAFAALPEGTVANLLLPENKEMLTKILTYHVVSGKFDSKTVAEAITANGGEFTITTVSGGNLVAKFGANGTDINLVDENGGVATVTIADVFQKNGVIHVINTVVLPK